MNRKQLIIEVRKIIEPFLKKFDAFDDILTIEE